MHLPPDAGGLIIREIGGPAEEAALAELTVAAFTAEAELSEGYLAELSDVSSRAREATVLVAVDGDGTVVGGITYLDRPSRWADLEGDEQAELRMLAVARAVQGRGVATRLVQAGVDRARAGGKSRITLHTTSWMAKAQRIYQRAGFQRRPERDLVLEEEGGLVLLGYELRLDG